MGLNGAGKSRRARTPLASEGAHILEIGNPPTATRWVAHFPEAIPRVVKCALGQWAIGIARQELQAGPGGAEPSERVADQNGPCLAGPDSPEAER